MTDSTGAYTVLESCSTMDPLLHCALLTQLCGLLVAVSILLMHFVFLFVFLLLLPNLQPLPCSSKADSSINLMLCCDFLQTGLRLVVDPTDVRQSCLIPMLVSSTTLNSQA